MKFLFNTVKHSGFAVAVYCLLTSANLPESTKSVLTKNALSKNKKIDNFQTDFIGEIIDYSYIKLSVNLNNDAKQYNSKILQVRGSYYEAISGKTFKVTGTYTPNTFLWKLNCFNQKNTRVSTFVGKENLDGSIEGKWSNGTIIHKFYLKRSNK